MLSGQKRTRTVAKNLKFDWAMNTSPLRSVAPIIQAVSGAKLTLAIRLQKLDLSSMSQNLQILKVCGYSTI